MILHGYVKQCKKCDFYLRDFIMFLMISELSGPLQKKKKKKKKKKKQKKKKKK